MVGGPVGAALAAGVMAPATALGSGIGNYINVGSFKKATPEDIKANSAEVDEVKLKYLQDFGKRNLT